MEVAINAVVSLLVGFALWALLPRGVVLTRSFAANHQGVTQPQTWTIRNESALPVKITKVTHTGVHTYNDTTGEIETRVLPPWVPHEEEGDLGIRLQFDDEVLELNRDSDDSPWAGQLVPPGDTLTAFVNLNRTLTIRYRRAGLFGLTERRTLSIDGGV